MHCSHRIFVRRNQKQWFLGDTEAATLVLNVLAWSIFVSSRVNTIHLSLDLSLRLSPSWASKARQSASAKCCGATSDIHGNGNLKSVLCAMLTRHGQEDEAVPCPDTINPSFVSCNRKPVTRVKEALRVSVSRTTKLVLNAKEKISTDDLVYNLNPIISLTSAPSSFQTGCSSSLSSDDATSAGSGTSDGGCSLVAAKIQIKSLGLIVNAIGISERNQKGYCTW